MQPDSTIAIVESEKTAVIASVLMPQYIWIAAGNINGLTLDKSSALKGRSVILFPDLSKNCPPDPPRLCNGAGEPPRYGGYMVARLLYLIFWRGSRERGESGLDIADYLIRQISHITPNDTAGPTLSIRDRRHRRHSAGAGTCRHRQAPQASTRMKLMNWKGGLPA